MYRLTSERQQIVANVAAEGWPSETLPMERLFRDARAPIVMAPTTDLAHDFIGRALCGLELL